MHKNGKSVICQSSSDEVVAVVPRGDCHPFLHWLAAGLFWLLSIIVFSQFVSRYVLNSSIAWTEEIARYLLIVICFLSVAIAMAKNAHVRVEFFYRYFPVRIARRISYWVDIGTNIFLGYLSILCFQLAGRTDQMMTTLDLSKNIIYYSVAISLVLATFYSFRTTYRHLRHGDSELTAVSAGIDIVPNE